MWEVSKGIASNFLNRSLLPLPLRPPTSEPGLVSELKGMTETPTDSARPAAFDQGAAVVPRSRCARTPTLREERVWRTTGSVVPRGRFRARPRRLEPRACRGARAVMQRALTPLGARSACRPLALLLLPPVRGRKTRHDPPAKSKVGRVKMPPAVDPAELFVLTERYRQYRQTVRALRLEFTLEVQRKAYEARAGVEAERKAQAEVAEHREMMAWNHAENRRLQELRIARLRQEAQERELWQAEEQARRTREEQARVQQKEQEVLLLQEEAKKFITRENLEARIESALDTPKDYNWAITRSGQVVRPQQKGS